MEILKWILVVLLAVGALSNVLLVGHERKPITSGAAALSVILDGLLIAWILTVMQ